MGTRLYPMTNDVASLEKLAGVPKGTARLLELYKSAEDLYIQHNEVGCIDPGERQQVEYDFHCMMHPDLERYDNFMLFGYGKFDLDLIGKFCLGNRTSGHTHHVGTVHKLFSTSVWSINSTDQPRTLNDAQIIELSAGFCWS